MIRPCSTTGCSGVKWRTFARCKPCEYARRKMQRLNGLPPVQSRRHGWTREMFAERWRRIAFSDLLERLGMLLGRFEETKS